MSSPSFLPILGTAITLALVTATSSLAQGSGAQSHSTTIGHASESASGAHEHDRDGQKGPYVLGDLSVEMPWSRATPPTANVAAGYMTLRNSGTAPGRLVGASTSASARVEIHTMEIVDDVMRMAEVPGGLEIPAEGETSLEPGGLHLMLVDLEAPLVEGQTVPVTLEFESGTLDVELVVQAMGASGGHDAHAN